MSVSFFKSIYKRFSILSLDVVGGAVIGAAWAGRLLSVQQDVWFFVILALSVWMMYTADHLVDAYRLKDQAHTERHLFHSRYFTSLVIIFIVLGIFNFVMVLLKLQATIIRAGLIIAGFTTVYFAALSFLKERKSLLLQKEVIVAFVYMAGVWTGPLVLRDFNLHVHEVLVLIEFFALVWSVILQYSFMEELEDRLDEHHTFATNFGRKACQRLIYSLLVFTFAVSISLIVVNQSEMIQGVSGMFLLMASFVGLMQVFPGFFKTQYRYRYLGELIFWLPVLLLLW